MQKQKKVFSIKELNKYIKLKLESDSILNDVWIRGEISNFTHHSSGHMYFTMKDRDSRIKCVMFSSQNQKLSFIPREGNSVLAGGNISVFERDGQYQFYVTEMQPAGIGNLFLAYEQLKKKLESEGLFANHNKKSIPKYPRVVGIITSPTGAAIRDILTTLSRRFPSANIVIYPVSVQGKLAAPSITKALEVMNQRGESDVIILGRGGGSLEELWAFNEEMVARAIYASNIPIISAVGHETDFTIADFTADLRAATPTAAAELAVPHQLELKQQIISLEQRLSKSIQHLIEKRREQLHRLLSSSPMRHPHKHLLQSAERMDRLKDQLIHNMKANYSKANEKAMKLDRVLSNYNPEQQIVNAYHQLKTNRHQLLLSMKSIVQHYNQHMHSIIRNLDALSPLKVMQRGYSLVYSRDHDFLISSIKQVGIGDSLKIKLITGQIDCQVMAIEGDEQNDGEKA